MLMPHLRRVLLLRTLSVRMLCASAEATAVSCAAVRVLRGPLCLSLLMLMPHLRRVLLLRTLSGCVLRLSTSVRGLLLAWWGAACCMKPSFRRRSGLPRVVHIKFPPGLYFVKR